MSVVSVPFESTGDGSICCGYGLGGGASESEGPEDLRMRQRLLRAMVYHLTYRFDPPGKVLPYGIGEFGESL